MKNLILIGLLLIAGISISQIDRTISGYVTEEKTGETIPGAVVFDTVSKKVTSTNEYGFFSLTVPYSEAVLLVRSTEMEPQMIVMPVESNHVNIALYEINELSEVVIRAYINREVENSNTGTINVQMDKVDKLPIILGEKDVMRVIQLLPGVKTGGEASSGILVRGGSPDQNLILLDGVPIYNASHLFGFFSTFNSDAISDMTLIKGGFPARYGGRASSVLDIKMKEGNMKHYNLEGSLGLIASRLLVEGPIKEGKTSFVVSGRRTYLDLLYRPIILAIEQIDAGYFFHDFNAKIQHKVNDKHHLYLSGYFGLDKVFVKEKPYSVYDNDGTRYTYNYDSRLQWGNKIGALRWNYIVNPKLFVNTTLTYSQYHFDVGMNDKTEVLETNGTKKEEFYSYGMNSGIEDWSIKSVFSYIPNTRHYVRFGFSETYHTFRPGINYQTVKNDVENISQESGSIIQYSHELGYFIEDDIQVSKKLKVNLGVHGSSFFSNGRDYHIPQPRLSANYKLNEKSSLKLGLSRMAQYMHLLSNTSIGLPTDLWVPATDKVEPITANQYSLGYYRELPKNMVFSVEGYYKKMNNLVQYKEGVSFISGATDWQERVTQGQGWAYGAEFFLEKKKGDFSGWISYTLSWSERQFDELNFGESFFHRYDQRHNLSVALTYKMNDVWDFGLVFVYGTGNALTLPSQNYSMAPNSTFSTQHWQPQLSNYDQMNGFRMPAYHRMDFGANKTKQKKYGTSVISYSVYNIYNRQNPFMVIDGYNNYGERALMQISLFPFIPSVSWKFKFDFDKIKQAKLEKNDAL